jgi:hypothetical protein
LDLDYWWYGDLSTVITKRQTRCYTQARNQTRHGTRHFLHRDVGEIIFRIVGSAALLLFLLWNPIVLPPRVWNASVIARGMTLDATLIVIGVGLFRSRRWAALLCAAVAVDFAIGLARTPDVSGVGLTAILLTPLRLTFIFWRNLVWGDNRRDPLFAFAGVMVSAIVH